MNNLITATLLCILLCGVFADDNSCSIPLSSQTQMKSDQISVQAKGISNNSTTVDYTYKKQFSTTPATAVGINGFDFNPSDVAGIQVSIVRSTQTKAGFKIAFNSNSNWKNLRVNFLSTNRDDIEIGEVSLSTASKADTFPLTYKFKNKWQSTDLLKYKVFISGFNLKTYEQTPIRINLEKAETSSTGINLIYSTRSSSTIIDAFSVNFVIFDGYNPSFRFAEGVISQSYLTAKYSIEIPKKGITELRTYMIGFTSFEVNSNSAVSIYSNLNDKFTLQIGSNDQNCQISVVSVSYLFLSVFPECGACAPYSIQLNGKCVQKCPDGYFVLNGKCELKTCQKGFYLSKNNCVKCPKYSDIKQCGNPCPEGTKLQGEACFSICTKKNQAYSYGSCVCADGYYRIGNSCQQCEIGTKYDYSQKKCVSICPKYSVFIKETLTCQCNNGYNMFHGSCVQCGKGQAFDLTWGCHPACGTNGVFNGRQCTCQFGYYMVNGKCQQCKSGEIYNPTEKKCKSVCKANQLWEVNRCICAEGYYRISDSCKKCGSNQVYEPSLQACRDKCVNGQIWFANKCQCNPGSYYINNSCHICTVDTKYDPKTKQCEKICKQKYEQFAYGKCVCIRSFERDTTGKCVPKKCPDNSYYNSVSDTCICNVGYFLSKTTNLCEVLPVCPPYSKCVNGICYCIQGYFMNQNKTQCIVCDKNKKEVWTGSACICEAGYVRGSGGVCAKEVIPPKPVPVPIPVPPIPHPCSENCPNPNPNPPKCKQNQYWNGRQCVCQTGYVLNQKSSCDKIVVPVPIPKCPYNSQFNGVKCICNQNFFELEPGLCATCPPKMTWNGKKCAYDKACWQGYAWDNKLECCLPIGNECPENAKWNGQACECSAGYNAFEQTCIKCEDGFQFDGVQCVPSTIDECIGVNRIVVNKKCVCKPDTYLYNGVCIKCAYPTVWNGQFCQGNTDACLSVPNSQMDPENKRCKCKLGYRGVFGTCVPIPGYIVIGGKLYSEQQGFRWVQPENHDDQMNGPGGRGGRGGRGGQQRGPWFDSEGNQIWLDESDRNDWQDAKNFNNDERLNQGNGNAWQFIPLVGAAGSASPSLNIRGSVLISSSSGATILPASLPSKISVVNHQEQELEEFKGQNQDFESPNRN